jgi:hypothetical protein
VISNGWHVCSITDAKELEVFNLALSEKLKIKSVSFVKEYLWAYRDRH